MNIEEHAKFNKYVKTHPIYLAINYYICSNVYLKILI